MTTEFKKNQTSFLIQAVLFTLALFGIHSYLIHYFGKEISFVKVAQVGTFITDFIPEDSI